MAALVVGAVSAAAPAERWLWRGAGESGSIGPAGGHRVAVVTTLRDVRDVLAAWLEWYRLVGLAHMFLYFDEPEVDEKPILDALNKYSSDFLSVVRTGPELRAEWRTLGSWPAFCNFVDDHMCRQLLNIAHCVRRCFMAKVDSPEAADWLLHLDHDELFLPPNAGLQAHFGHLASNGCRHCLYQNFEAVPEKHTLTPFDEVTLFKVPASRVPKTPNGARGMDFWEKTTKSGNYFLYYENGKSAVRIRRGAGASEFAPRSVHVLMPDGDASEIIRSGAAWTNFAADELADLKVGWMRSHAEEEVSAARVLHYPATHWERLLRKYDRLKAFPSVRFGGDFVLSPSFHLEARDSYVANAGRGKAAQGTAIKTLLEKAAMLRSQSEVDAQLRCGTITRLTSVRDSLRSGEFLPPPRLTRMSPLERVQKAPSKVEIAALLLAPSTDVKLLPLQGGLLKHLEAGLDLVAKRLEDVGWAACDLGGNPKVLSQAMKEACALEGRMAAGSTVVQNKVVNDPGNKQAHRGDKTLWMQEHGLGALAPSLALLEQSLAALGLQLDERLQRSRLKLRLTERCDAMLAPKSSRCSSCPCRVV